MLIDSKTNQLPQPSQSQESSLPKKNTFNLSLAKILKPMNCNLEEKNLSVQIIKKHNKHNFSVMEHCPLQVIRNHASRSQIYTKDLQISEVLKRSAYHFFNQQKSKIINSPKTHQYLLPKICMKSKKLYNSSTANDYSTIDQKDCKLVKKMNEGRYQNQKRSKVTKIKTVEKQFDGEQPVQEARQNFKAKCEVEYAKLCFNLPHSFRREKCFFDLTQQEISQLYSKQNINLATQQSANKQNVSQKNIKQNKKFKLLKLAQSSMIEENKSIPLFLMERLSSNDLFGGKGKSFVTDVPRIQTRYVQKTKIRNIL